jgi:hypothetical protein
MIHTTPSATDIIVEVLEILKELKELGSTTLHNAPSVSCVNCGGPHDDYQCQPSGFDKSPPPQFSFSLNSHEKCMAKRLTEEQVAKIDSIDDFEKAVRESYAKEKAAKSSSLFRFIHDDDDDEDSIQMKEYYKASSSSSVEIPSEEAQGDKSMQELLAEEHMKNIESMCASLLYLPQSAVITPEVHTHSLIMGDEHLSTVPNKESDELIKSSVEVLVPIPRESQGTFDHMFDIPPPLFFPSNHDEMFSDSTDDNSLSCEDIVYMEELPSELVSLEEENGEIDTEIKDEALRATLLNVNLLISKIEAFNMKPISSPIPIKDSEILSDDPIPEFEAFTFDHMGEKISDSTTSHSHNSLPIYDSFAFEEFSGELAHHVITPPEFDSPGGDALNHENLQIPTHPPGLFLSLPFEIQTQATEPDLEEENQIMIFIMVFFLFFTYKVTSPVLHSFGNEDTIFDPGIFIYHFREPGLYLIGVELSRASNVCPNILNESPMEIISSTSCFPKDK